MNPSEVRSLIVWSPAYRREWDDSPDLYAEQGIVGWGKSRRLGMLRMGNLKAYVGVQHIDPGIPGWDIAEEPQARFFLSVFRSNRTVAFRTFPALRDVLTHLLPFVSSS